jgi:hypothetical protein
VHNQPASVDRLPDVEVHVERMERTFRRPPVVLDVSLVAVERQHDAGAGVLAVL